MKKMRILPGIIVVVLLSFIISANFAPLMAQGSDVSSAKKVMKNAKKIANIFEEGSHLVVEFYSYPFPNDINKRFKLVRSIADADCILKGGPRTIFYYNPGGKKMAQADTLRGVRLVDDK